MAPIEPAGGGYAAPGRNACLRSGGLGAPGRDPPAVPRLARPAAGRRLRRKPFRRPADGLGAPFPSSAHPKDRAGAQPEEADAASRRTSRARTAMLLEGFRLVRDS